MAENEEYYEPDIISVTDDDGNELLFELLERYETDDDVYVAITKYNETDEDIVDGDFEVITLKFKQMITVMNTSSKLKMKWNMNRFPIFLCKNRRKIRC